MNNYKTYIASAILVLLLVGIAAASSPPPAPVPQSLGITDTLIKNQTTSVCRNCHGGDPTLMVPMPAANIHHDMLAINPATNQPNTTLGCTDCHLQNNAYKETNCLNCHNGTAWYKNPLVINLTKIRGAPGTPHHNSSKNSSTNMIVQAKDLAASRHCKTCHGDGVLDNYDDGHDVKYLSPQVVSVFADFKVNESKGGGVKWGGCQACHDVSSANPIINSNHDTHHIETTGMKGKQCNYCHIGTTPRAEPIPDFSPDANTDPFTFWFNDSTNLYYNQGAQRYAWDTSEKHLEVNNRSIMYLNKYPDTDPVNATGCTKCHSFADLHNIEGNSTYGDAQYNIDNDIGGYGHVGNNTDCNGCHAGFQPADDQRPIIEALAVALNGIAPGTVTAGTATDVTLTGENFDQAGAGYTTTALIDGQSATIVSNTGTQMVVTAPSTLSTGTHSLQIDVGGKTSTIGAVVVAAPVAITSATLTSGKIDIVGSSFGTTQMQIEIEKPDGTTALADSFDSWTNTEIVAVSSVAAVGDTVTVVTGAGSASATIQAGTVTDSVTVTAPNGGENWKRGTTQEITWNHVGSSPAANVKIELLKGTTVNKVIASSTPNDGSYSWTIPSNQATATNYKVRITSISHTPTYSDTSDNYFQISR